MTISVDVAPEVQEELARQAAAHGRAVEAYAASLLEEAARQSVRKGSFSPERLENTMREMSQFSHKIPELSDEVFTRASFYQDHD